MSAVAPGPPKPLVMRRDGDERLYIEWSDGLVGRVTWVALRENCPCAGCREEHNKPPDPFRILSEKELSHGPPRPMSMSPVGFYAYKITWNDGHDTGIFTIEQLRALCT